VLINVTTLTKLAQITVFCHGFGFIVYQGWHKINKIVSFEFKPRFIIAE